MSDPAADSGTGPATGPVTGPAVDQAVDQEAAALFRQLFHHHPPPDDPYPLYEQLRARGPIVRVEDGAWLTTRFDLSVEVLRHRHFGNDSDSAGRARGGPGWRERPALRTLAGMLLMANPPRHTQLRALLTSHFSAHPLQSLRPAVQRHVSALRDALVEAGDVDFISAFAEILPRWVIGDVIGIPEEGRLHLRDQTLAFNAVFERAPSPEQLRDADSAALQIDGYVRQLIAAARRNPRGDLLSSLVAASDAGALPVPELVGLVFQVYNASYQTVLGLLGNGLAALLAHPDQYARLRADPGLARSAVAEMLRYDPPVQTTGRHAAERLRLGPAGIEPGELVIAVLGAANRDPERYPDPGRFDIGRRGLPSIAFGYGIHYCIGATLANLQGEVAVAALADPGLVIEPAGPPGLRESANMRSIEQLPVSVRPARR